MTLERHSRSTVPREFKNSECYSRAIAELWNLISDQVFIYSRYCSEVDDERGLQNLCDVMDDVRGLLRKHDLLIVKSNR